MKAPVTPNRIKLHKKPSTMLGFVLIGVVVLAGALLLWQLTAARGSWGKLKIEHLLATIGVMTAVCGWLIAGFITLRNSTKQHTINTLLQSRLSATYMGYADKLSQHYMAFDARKAANPAIKESPTDAADIMALRYILNYFEFVAVGIKRGDLDEGTLRDSLRTILRKNVTMSMSWIGKERVSNPNLYTHLLWLFDRWGGRL